MLSPSARLAGLHYPVIAKDVNPLPQQLRALPDAVPSSSGYLNVPPQYRTKKITKLVKRITRSNTTPYGKAVAIQDWFTAPGHFRYTLKVPSTQSPSALIQFLTKSKTGYCQQFAFAMAVLARLVGIPSRVVVGYTQGTFIGNDNWQVKTSDAHAWPELYFPSVGWLRFEPTPPTPPGSPGRPRPQPRPIRPRSPTSRIINPPTGQQVTTNPNPGPTPESKSQAGLNKLKKTAPGGAGGNAAGQARRHAAHRARAHRAARAAADRARSDPGRGPPVAVVAGS